MEIKKDYLIEEMRKRKEFRAKLEASIFKVEGELDMLEKMIRRLDAKEQESKPE